MEHPSAGHFMVKPILTVVILYIAILLFVAFLVRYHTLKKKERPSDEKDNNHTKIRSETRRSKRRQRARK